MRTWRLARALYPVLDGEGARLYGGRWNEHGTPVGYTAAHLSLAVLELFVHLDPDLIPEDLTAYEIDVPDRLAREIVDEEMLPEDWSGSFPASSTGTSARTTGVGSELHPFLQPLTEAHLYSSGKEIAWVHPPHGAIKSGSVIGVVEDFHIKPLQEAIEPMVLLIWPQRLSYAYVRIAPGNPFATVVALKKTWETVYPDHPFDYTFLDEHMAHLYKAEQRLARIFGTFATLAILVACMGLFGLAAFTAQQRTKEIGIRKVLGASIPGIVRLLATDFVKLVLIAVVIAVPVGYLTMDRWLADFAYRIEIGPGVFLMAGVVALLVAVLTVSYQAVKAALADPVESLRYE